MIESVLACRACSASSARYIRSLSRISCHLPWACTSTQPCRQCKVSGPATACPGMTLPACNTSRMTSMRGALTIAWEMKSGDSAADSRLTTSPDAACFKAMVESRRWRMNPQGSRVRRKVSNHDALATSFAAQWVEQGRQAVVIDFLHQLEQPADLACGEALAGEPVEVAPRQVGDQAALIFAERHFAGHQQLQVFGFHWALGFMGVWFGHAGTYAIMPKVVPDWRKAPAKIGRAS